MGCGKSTIGRVLAAKLGSDFIDTDEIIEREKGMSILQIFSRWGEEYFRQLERSFLPPLLQKAKNCVIALGGGAVKDPVIRKNLSSSSLTIWVWSSLEECLKRNQGKPKPLLIRNSSPQQQERLFQERIPLYARASNLVMTNRDGQLSSTVRLTYEEINSSF
jgi:shikimate kinase